MAKLNRQNKRVDERKENSKPHKKKGLEWAWHIIQRTSTEMIKKIKIWYNSGQKVEEYGKIKGGMVQMDTRTMYITNWTIKCRPRK